MRRRATLLLAGAISLWTLVFDSAPVHGADPVEVEELIRQGVDLRRQGRDAAALPLFERAYRLAPTPRTAAQLGLVEMTLGYRLPAERHLDEALASPNDLWVERNRRQLTDSLARVRDAIGEVAVGGSPDGAEVLVNGDRVGQLPLSRTVRVGEGPALVELRAPGYLGGSRSVTVLGGKRHSLRIDLSPNPNALGVVLLPVPVAGVEHPVARAPSPVEPALEEAEGDQGRRPAESSLGSGALDLDTLLGVQFWLAGVSPSPEPSVSARLSAGYSPVRALGGRLALRLGAAAAASFITEDAGRVYFVSLLANPGLRVAFSARVSAWLDVGLGVLVLSGVQPDSVLLIPGTQRVTGALSAFEFRPSVGVGYTVTRSLFVLLAMSLAWSEKPDPQFRERSLARLEQGLGMGVRF